MFIFAQKTSNSFETVRVAHPDRVLFRVSAMLKRYRDVTRTHAFIREVFAVLSVNVSFGGRFINRI